MTLVALMVYEPGVLGAVKVVLVPFTLCAGAKEPPAGVRLQVTPAGSLVETESIAACPSVSAAARGVIAIEMIEGCHGSTRDSPIFAARAELLSATVNVSGAEFSAVVGVPAITPLEASATSQPATILR